MGPTRGRLDLPIGTTSVPKTCGVCSHGCHGEAGPQVRPIAAGAEVARTGSHLPGGVSLSRAHSVEVDFLILAMLAACTQGITSRTCSRGEMPSCGQSTIRSRWVSGRFLALGSPLMGSRNEIWIGCLLMPPVQRCDKLILEGRRAAPAEASAQWLYAFPIRSESRGSACGLAECCTLGALMPAVDSTTLTPIDRWQILKWCWHPPVQIC